MRANRAAYFTDANALTCLSETFLRASEFIEHKRELQTECDRLRVHAMAPPDHRGHFEPARLIANRRSH